MVYQYYEIKGIPADNPNDLPKRRNIVTWYQNALDHPDSEDAKQVSLFILALEEFQNTRYDEADSDITRLSYYRVAAIHGLPLAKWDNVNHEVNSKGHPTMFCTHHKTTFLTWHRPYLALYEQILYKNMQDIIAAAALPEGPVKEAWKSAAKNWRLPYWDYANHPAVPAIAATNDIELKIVDPRTGKSKKYDDKHPNPLWTYRVRDGQGKPVAMGDLKGELSLQYDDDGDFGLCVGTNRAVNPSTEEDNWINGVSETKFVTDTLTTIDDNSWPDPQIDKKDPRSGVPANTRAVKAKGTIRDNVYRLMNPGYFRQWSTFASAKYYYTDANAQEWLSVEGVHDMIHGWVGSGNVQGRNGHMGAVPVAAFDPIFWHHHCFIDLIFHSWQKITNYEHWFDGPRMSDDPKPSDDLKPFHKTQELMYKSDDTKHISDFLYDYDFTVPTPEGQVSGDASDHQSHIQSLKRAINENFSTSRSEVLQLLPPEQKEDNDLIINVRYNRFGLDGGKSYWIHFFVGEVGEPANYAQNPDRVGSVYNFSSVFEQSGCQNCKDQAAAGVLTTGQIPITGAIVKDWLNRDIHDLPSDRPFAEAEIASYLEKHFHWRVATAAGQEVPIESLPDLKVFVMLGDAHHSEDPNVTSTYGNYEPLWPATQNKIGGGVPGDLD